MTKKEIKKMRKAGQLAAECLEYVCSLAVPGVTPVQLDEMCFEWHKAKGVVPAPLNYKGFPNSCCISVNNVVCHGIPDHRPLQNGDIVSIDVTPKFKGFHGDTCKTIIIGDDLHPENCKFVLAAYDAMWEGIKVIKPGVKVAEIANAVSAFVDTTPYSLVREYGGHGIGKEFHTDPFVGFHPDYTVDWELKAGQVITVEPMINMGRRETTLDKDGWTVRTIDNSISAQFEHTILVTEDGYEVLTEYKE